ncbi:hypothetical protein [Rhizobium rhizogenes]|uniref:Uncharacterized protein n=1 Tax=Rhizobium rhizogenes NBRC 13257 TaxID=1220581 RepID=A0AA87U2S3_RHIRH|nr:hypothetical protein [Rhizobium rhizogenes]NTG27152.1 hypothetical protein [Rhizobium rhizogenes]NTG60142.1 hypothetical protein [Rhizobium rhizogenes]NTG66693.1 hypothetical protein [Rhizobium rhizogenes]NTG79665.1 hypothetical protein [Rhizobium rhizogenes]NTH95345.1 hypothetical protein [Rhizobium rhizogenes]
MRDLIESILPRTYLSELDEEYGVVDVEDILEVLDFETDARHLSSTSRALQKKFAIQHVEEPAGVFSAYTEMLSEIEHVNDWQPSGHVLHACSLRTFINRIADLDRRVKSEAFVLPLLDEAA